MPDVADLRPLQQHAVTVDICPWCWWMAEQKVASPSLFDLLEAEAPDLVEVG